MKTFLIHFSIPALLLPAAVGLAALERPPAADTRNFQHDPTVRAAYRAKWAEWARIYRDYDGRSGEASPLTAPPLRLAAEYRVGYRPDYAALREAGYNGVLLLFDTSDDPGALALWTLGARAAGMLVFVAYAPPERSDATVFPDPVALAARLRRLGALADGLLIGWRRTSVHLFAQDRAWQVFVIEAARADRPELPVIGELYAGETNAGAATLRQPAEQIPPEAAAAIAVNYVSPTLWPPGMRSLLSGIRSGRLLLVVSPGNWYLLNEYAEAGFTDFIHLIH